MRSVTQPGPVLTPREPGLRHPGAGPAAQLPSDGSRRRWTPRRRRLAELLAFEDQLIADDHFGDLGALPPPAA
jgi:hypothetical protein